MLIAWPFEPNLETPSGTRGAWQVIPRYWYIEAMQKREKCCADMCCLYAVSIFLNLIWSHRNCHHLYSCFFSTTQANTCTSDDLLPTWLLRTNFCENLIEIQHLEWKYMNEDILLGNYRKVSIHVLKMAKLAFHWKLESFDVKGKWCYLMAKTRNFVNFKGVHAPNLHRQSSLTYT